MKDYLNLLKKRINNINMKKIFYDNKLVFLFSVFVSFTIWVCMNASGADTAPVTITDIPVSINLSDNSIRDGLRIFSGQNIKAQIDISGNRLIVGQVTKDNIQVTAPQVSTITSPGTYALELNAKKVGILSDYEFASSLQPAFVTIMVDRYREAEFEIEPEIEFSADPNYFLGATVLSSSKVILAGPDLEISKIKRVAVKGKIDKELKSTYSSKMPVIMYDAYGKQIESETISLTVKEVEVTIPVLMRKNLGINPNFKNVPEGLNLSCGIVKVVPNSLEVAGPEEQIKEMSAIELDAIDFNDLNVQKNRFNLQVNLPSGCKSLNNIYSVEISVDTTGFREKSFSVSQISFLNVPEGKSAKAYNNTIEVKLVGTTQSIRQISADNITIEIDLAGKEELNGAMEVPANIKVNGFKDVWAYGKYLINIQIS